LYFTRTRSAGKPAASATHRAISWLIATGTTPLRRAQDRKIDADVLTSALAAAEPA
jgi:hypothetical protein